MNLMKLEPMPCVAMSIAVHCFETENVGISNKTPGGRQLIGTILESPEVSLRVRARTLKKLQNGRRTCKHWKDAFKSDGRLMKMIQDV